jgi:hypothetical protein
LGDDSLTTISSTPKERKNEVSQKNNKERNISQAPTAHMLEAIKQHT